MTDAQRQTGLALFDEGRYAEGVRLILKAADGGDGPACATAAALFARGYAGDPDWPRALDWLQRSAELGFEPAQAQLRLLSGVPDGTEWGRLRGAVDIDAWREVPPPITISQSPAIHAAPGLLSPQLCEALIARARRLLRPATVYNETKGGNTRADGRRHSGAEFGIADMDLVTEAICLRLCALAGMPAVNAETLQVLHYRVGEYFAPHYDFWTPGFEGHAATLEAYGQRAFTVLVYLNDDLEGGETEFLELGLRLRGRKGDALMFRNVDAKGRPDRGTLHAGRPPTEGEKWLLSLWIRDRAPPEIGEPGVAAAMAGP